MNRKSIPLLVASTFKSNPISIMAFALSAGAALAPATARGQIFVANNGSGTVGEYTASGATVNASLISGLSYPVGIAVSGSDVFVVNNGTTGYNGSIGEYTTSGATVNASLISGLSGPTAIAAYGSDLFVVNSFGSVGEYTTSGATVNAALPGTGYPCGIAVSGSDLFVTYNDSETVWEYTMSGAVVTERLVSGLLHPTDIALSGSDLFVMNNYGSTIGEYTTSGSTVNASLIPNVGNYGLALSGSDLFVGNYQAGTIGEYTTPGATVNASLISGLNDPDGIAVVVPSKLTWNNAGGSGDGLSWDTVQQNWNDGTDAVFYSDGDSVTFNDANNSMSSGGSNPNAYNVTLNTTVAPASIVVNNCLGNYSISGNGTIGGTSSLTKSGTGTLTLSTANTYSGGTIVCGGLLVIEPTRSTTSALPNGALTISGSGNIQLANNVTAGSPPATSNVNITSLSISGNGTLDIGNNRIIIDYSSDATDPIASIAAWISSGYAAGTWAGAGITSSAAAFNSGSYSIGYADGADPGNPAGLYRGQIEIMYTLLGDANLDGKVNGTDFNLMATNFNQAVTTGWDKGDFNYDGKVNGNDFVLLADNFNQSAVSAADLAALDAFAVANGISLANAPEPACAGMMVMAGLGIVRRRRRLLRSVPRFRALLSGVAPHLDT